jgi:hypothetical protein
VQGRDDEGQIAPGFAGSTVHDPVPSLLMCHGKNTAWTLVNGRTMGS